MSLFDDTHMVERPAFFDGQQLYAEDLQQLAGFHAAMRRLHNESLHPPGIGNGFPVAGKRGDREVTIGAGLCARCARAGDRLAGADRGARAAGRGRHRRRAGRVRHRRVLSGPGGPRGGRDARRGVPAGWRRPAARAPRGLLGAPGQGRVGRLAAVDPRQGEDIKLARKIVLTRAYVRNCKLDADLVIARAPQRPPGPCAHIACGHVAPVAWQDGRLPWRASIPVVA